MNTTNDEVCIPCDVRSKPLNNDRDRVVVMKEAFFLDKKGNEWRIGGGEFPSQSRASVKSVCLCCSLCVCACEAVRRMGELTLSGRLSFVIRQ